MTKETDAEKEVLNESKSSDAEKKIGPPITAEKTASSEDEIDDVEPGEAMVIDEPMDTISSGPANSNSPEKADSSNPAQLNTTSRLLAAGVSVSVISRKKSTEGHNKKDHNTEKTNNETTLPESRKSTSNSKSIANSASGDSAKKIGLGSDISVTVVQKKKSIDGGN